MLDVLGNVTPDKVVSTATPGGTFRPVHACVKPLDWGIAYFILSKARLKGDDVRLGIANGRRVWTIVTSE